MSFFNTELNTNSINYDSVNGIIIKNADNTTGNISLSQSGIILTSNGGGSSKGIQFKSSDGDISTSNVWSINLFSNTDNDFSIWHNDNLRFFYKEDGAFTIKTVYNQDYVNGSNKADSGLNIQMAGETTNQWTLNIDNGNDLIFFWNSTSKGYLRENADVANIDFTGQHRSLLNRNIDNSSIGLIVSSTGKYVNLDNTLNTNINESLPVCIITSNDNDKKVFGVLSDKEDSESIRSYSSGNWGSVYSKQNTNEQRMYINSVGEGAIWVCNKNGNIENGDYITSSTVSGYGIKQADGLLHNYTVAKITCDCNFSTTKIVQQKLKVISTTDADGNTTIEIDYDANGDVQYEDDLDENGNQQMVYPLETRFLLPDGTQITEEEYNTRLGNGENVYIACFVGCTYHCG